MKILICAFFILTAGGLQAQSSFYDLTVVSSSGKVISLSAYKGKKLLIVIASPEALQAKTAAWYLGKIQAAYPAVSVLVLPPTAAGTDSAGDIP